ncbi:MAG: hypothetical protein K2W95_23640 [Candidatus Obscuribacterales bacterium]|nr:hypothetical protein [Candidatus Obscuribacterales bacterium]
MNTETKSKPMPAQLSDVPESQEQIPVEHRELWLKLSVFQFDEPGVPLPFSVRLAERMKWSHEFALQVIEEYRKFLFLLKTAGHEVTPAKSVDEAWHLHLQYTRSYWEHLCLEIFNEAIHHNPGNGSGEDIEKYAAVYQRTLDDYAAIFGEPPVHVWGRPNHLIAWRNILLKLPVGRKARSRLLNLFRHSSDEAN